MIAFCIGFVIHTMSKLAFNDWATVIISIGGGAIVAYIASYAGAEAGGKVAEKAAIRGAERAQEIEYGIKKCVEIERCKREFISLLVELYNLNLLVSQRLKHKKIYEKKGEWKAIEETLNEKIKSVSSSSVTKKEVIHFLTNCSDKNVVKQGGFVNDLLEFIDYAHIPSIDCGNFNALYCKVYDLELPIIEVVKVMKGEKELEDCIDKNDACKIIYFANIKWAEIVNSFELEKYRGILD